MARKRGDVLLKLLRQVSTTTNWLVETNCDQDRSEWKLSGRAWDAKVIVNPHRWMGLEFNARDRASGRTVHYAVDTDLYDISRDDERSFSEAIERQIVEFLICLRRGEVLLGQDGSKLVLIFPSNDSYISVNRGLFSVTSKILSEKPERYAEFRSVT